MSLEDLQKTMNKSVANARGFSSELFKDKQVDAAQVEELTNASQSMTIATLDREGKPHATIVAAARTWRLRLRKR